MFGNFFRSPSFSNLASRDRSDLEAIDFGFDIRISFLFPPTKFFASHVSPAVARPRQSKINDSLNLYYVKFFFMAIIMQIKDPAHNGIFTSFYTYDWVHDNFPQKLFLHSI